LVKARIARGWTQKQLAAALGVSEQMVQKDEAGNYKRAGVARLAEVGDVLGYRLTGRLLPDGGSIGGFAIGVDAATVAHQSLPPALIHAPAIPACRQRSVVFGASASGMSSWSINVRTLRAHSPDSLRTFHSFLSTDRGDIAEWDDEREPRWHGIPTYTMKEEAS
jgi:transcriptional regulator with XRE-family HTH domain